MREPGYSDALRVLRDAAGGDLQHVLDAACEPVPAWDPVVYLADFSGGLLFPLAVRAAEEDVAGSMAGRAFTTGQPVTAERDGAVRVWVPVTEQASRTGVLAVTVPHASPEFLEQVELLGVFAGLAIAAAARVSDIPYVRRQGREMSLPAGMQWDLLPPLNTRTPGILIAGLLEPAYDIAGDAFDYAVGDRSLDFAIIDGMGHGISSTLLTGLAVGAYRHARRGGAPVLDIHLAIDRALADYYGDDSFATGIVGRLTFATGRLEWSSAGHPPPLLLRGRKVVAELTNEPVLPFGLRGTPQLSNADLEPGDAILLYTDGVTEARGPDGDLFGVARLTDLIEREAASGQPPEEILRRLVRALLDHQPEGLRDDATLLLVQWTGRPSWDLAYLAVVLRQWGSRSGCAQALQALKEAVRR
jgi:serine phosphatase RsbU (regulator of sigma subunit)